MAALDDTEWSPDPLERLRELRAARETVEFWIAQAVQECRIGEAVAWQAIGDALNITRAAAWEHWHDLG